MSTTPESTTSTATRGDRFMAAFNGIERFLRDKLDADDHVGFTELVRQARQLLWITEEMSDDLSQYAKLRNAIVHGEYYDSQPIADPREDVVATMEHLCEVITSDREALRQLPVQHTVNVAPDDKLTDVLEVIKETGFTRFPVYHNGEFQFLLTAGALTKWFADHPTNTVEETVTVAHVRAYSSHSDRAEIVPRDITAPAVVAKFSSVDKTGHAPAALIVTEHGKTNQKPIRIIVPGDIPDLMQDMAY